MAQVAFIGAKKLAELLQEADAGAGLMVLVESKSRLAVGKDPLHPTLSIDFTTESIAAFEPPNVRTSTMAEEAQHATPADTEPSAQSRRSGSYWFELSGKRSQVSSLRDLLRKSLIDIENLRPGTLEKLSHIKPRSKRIVAREKSLLFENEKMADEFGATLKNGWWYGTNNSAQETRAWLERACSCADLKWGIDFKTSAN